MTIYHLKTRELLQEHLESLLLLLDSSPHQSRFAGAGESDRREALAQLAAAGGLLLKASYGQAAAGILIAEIRRGNEFGVLELWIDPDAEDRVVDLLFEACERETRRRNYRAIYCDSEWFRSVENPRIREKFIQRS